jgi:hypothetical protein
MLDFTWLNDCLFGVVVLLGIGVYQINKKIDKIQSLLQKQKE